MRMTLAAAALVVASGAAFAQTTAPSTAPSATPAAPAAPAAGSQTPGAGVNTPPSTTSPSPSAVQTRNTQHRTAAAPVAGRNSFTQAQAARRIAAAGYTKVTGLKKDGQGIWRGQAEKDGNPVSVSLDYQGNVTGQ